MKLTGRQTKVEHFEVEISPTEAVQKVKELWLKDQRGEFIQNGKWFRGEHGSHYWEEDRGEALPDQIAIYDAFKLILEVARNIK